MTKPLGMKESIERFATQFGWLPEVRNAARLKNPGRIIVCGMGGSHLAADLITFLAPDLRLMVWSDYGLPPIPASERKYARIILSSYSGNTEETIDAFHAAGKARLRRAVIAAGGKLIELAKSEGVPYVEMPDMGLQPRAALGLSLKGLLAILDDKASLAAVSALARTLKPKSIEAKGKALAAKLKEFVPVIYASHRNRPVAYNWKIKFNETGKIPAFYNVIPEMNHNEMTGFDATRKSKKLSRGFRFIFLADPSDHPRVQKRMRIMAGIYKKRGLTVITEPFGEAEPLMKIFSSLLLADWAAYYMAIANGADPTQVPMVEEFKSLMR